jgi:hypothetical protein
VIISDSSRQAKTSLCERVLGEALSLSLTVTVTVTDAAALEAALALIAGLARLRGDAP